MNWLKNLFGNKSSECPPDVDSEKISTRENSISKESQADDKNLNFDEKCTHFIAFIFATSEKALEEFSSSFKTSTQKNIKIEETPNNVLQTFFMRLGSSIEILQSASTVLTAEEKKIVKKTIIYQYEKLLKESRGSEVYNDIHKIEKFLNIATKGVVEAGGIMISKAHQRKQPFEDMLAEYLHDVLGNQIESLYVTDGKVLTKEMKIVNPLSLIMLNDYLLLDSIELLKFWKNSKGEEQKNRNYKTDDKCTKLIMNIFKLCENELDLYISSLSKILPDEIIILRSEYNIESTFSMLLGIMIAVLQSTTTVLSDNEKKNIESTMFKSYRSLRGGASSITLDNHINKLKFYVDLTLAGIELAKKHIGEKNSNSKIIEGAIWVYFQDLLKIADKNERFLSKNGSLTKEMIDYMPIVLKVLGYFVDKTIGKILQSME